MAKKSLVIKAARKPKFKVRSYNRCLCCGRSRGVYRKFMMCRLCIRLRGNRGEIPGLVKSSW